MIGGIARVIVCMRSNLQLENEKRRAASKYGRLRADASLNESFY
jgi:hypothetical protein